MSDTWNYLDEISKRESFGDDSGQAVRSDRYWLMGIVRQALAQGCQKPGECPRYVTETGVSGFCAVCELREETQKRKHPGCAT